MLQDSYSHPEPEVVYIKESIYGKGISQRITHMRYERKCHCNVNNCKNADTCICVNTFSENYNDGILCDSKLNGGSGVFECNELCECRGHCYNSVTQKGPNSNLKVIQSSDKGFCVFTTGPLRKGTYVCEYAGEVLCKSEADSRISANCSRYLMALREHCTDTVIETYVDAYRFGNIGRYINHSCSPNCAIVPVRSGKVIPKLAIFTIKDVPLHNELTFDYSPSSTSPSTTPCLCRSPNCRHFLPSDTSHRADSLLSVSDSNYKFLQIYYLGNSSQDIDLHCTHNSSVKRSIVEQLQTFFHQHNQLIILFRTPQDLMPSDNHIEIRVDKTAVWATCKTF